MSTGVGGLHHVTVIAGEDQRNLDFYTSVLGLRLVKRTVNFDDPGTHHFYYGDETGRPGTILTFFPWGRRVVAGQPGTGQTTATALLVDESVVGRWADRVGRAGILVEEGERFGSEILAFEDPDGMRLELVGGSAGPGGETGEFVGLHSVTMTLKDVALTAELLTGLMGYRLIAEEGDRMRFEAAEAEGVGAYLDVVGLPGGNPGRIGRGSVHHIAFRVPDSETQERWRGRLLDRGFDVSPVMDRVYFRSIYFREPGGVLFEIATDPPGFGIDESPAELGSGLRLPSWLERQRGWIEARLPEIRPPHGAVR